QRDLSAARIPRPRLLAWPVPREDRDGAPRHRPLVARRASLPQIRTSAVRRAELARGALGHVRAGVGAGGGDGDSAARVETDAHIQRLGIERRDEIVSYRRRQVLMEDGLLAER